MNEFVNTRSSANRSLIGSPDRLNLIARKMLFMLLSKATAGQLVWNENGYRVAEFGDSSDVLRAEINIIDQRFYKRALLGGSCAAGESFVDGWWNTPDLTKLIQFCARNLKTVDRWEKALGWLPRPFKKLRVLRRYNSVKQAKQNILSHYDLGNELYQLFLDERMQYSSALFQSDKDSLSAAQENKMRRLCEQLQLKSSDHLLEIGSGWGGLAIYAAQHYGCRVTTTTISDAQYRFARKAIDSAGLSDRITLLNRDYRKLQGCFDKLVSVEMIEAVGKAYLPTFFKQVNRLLKPGGLMALQAITIADQRYQSYSRNEDFIQKHIFPGGFLPSISVLTRLMGKHTHLVTRDLKDIGIDYANTLAHWRDKTLDNKQTLNALGYDERFLRLWLFYLGYCEGGFRERHISAIQLLASKPG
jgi:cyclopropane-fatty-acyl-phospholipid synthase